jgi:hypothetical protein
MNNSYTINQTSRTACQMVISGLLASQCLASPITDDSIAHYERRTLLSYEIESTSRSFDGTDNLFLQSSVSDIDSQLLSTVSNVYGNLVENQELLGDEFETVLYSNLINLYES